MPDDPREREREDPDDLADADERPTVAYSEDEYGERFEVRAGDTVDGDLNGAPELAGLYESQEWEAADVLDAMENAEADLEREGTPLAVVLEAQVDERRQVLLERMSEASALGLGALFETVAAETAPDAPGAPVVADEGVLRQRLERLDDALGRLETSTEPEPEPVPRPGPVLRMRPRVRNVERARPFGMLLALFAGGAALWAWSRRRR